ncbi:MAG: hypothetical protein LBU35_00435 [Holosporales bacterium]|jgi:hypothetical protein|nr:hypothetical protein [Holosporales bacterium]
MERIELTRGSVEIYDFDAIKLHAYASKNALSEECFVLEKGDKLVMIENVSFFNNIKELASYVRDLKKELCGVIISYHAAGGTCFQNVKKYSTIEAMEYAKNGPGKIMVDEFSTTFGKDFDSAITEPTDIILENKINIGDIEFIIKRNNEAFDIEIPEINSIYIHMLGSDCHSIIFGEKHADLVIDNLKSYIAKKYAFILTSHHVPENLQDAEIKIAYLERLKRFAKMSHSAQDFKNSLKNEYPNYFGENYLDMTASYFFKI